MRNNQSYVSDAGMRKLASAIPTEFEANALAIAFMHLNDVATEVESGPLEAMGFSDMLKIGIAQLEATLAVHKAASLQIGIALECVMQEQGRK